MKGTMKKTKRSPRKKQKIEAVGQGSKSRTSDENILLSQDATKHAEARTETVSIQQIFGSTSGQSVSKKGEGQQVVLPSPATGLGTDNEAGQKDKSILRGRMPKLL